MGEIISDESEGKLQQLPFLQVVLLAVLSFCSSRLK